MHMALTTEKIVGGRQVEDMKNWNWIGQLGGYCGGSLVADDMFLTAAHCCASTRIGQTIYFGVLNPWKDQSKSQKRKVKEMLNHPDFVRSTLTHDICMIQLDSPIERTRTVRPICLSESAPVKNIPSYVAGWGLTEEGGQQSRDLMEVSVPIVTNKQCQSAYSHRPVDDSMVCAGKVEGGEDGCQGDSGGPIVTVDGEGNVSLAGVVSWGVGCARPGKFGVYSRVDTQLDFIHWSIQTLRGDYDGSLNSFDLSKNSLSGSQMPNPGGEPGKI
ncbi:Oidioi.mRNA.OKI2018_I69.chr1.g2511.t1.cds [Oikopleura dioica]|uniref:Oidioi.mRNA.OKI2018_I69.chr1.g2511.t1.cds n=1 Tax=Oikopleura dioica TaxID=34765 RepID=A0ABN7SY79_OIKDI|nr:Oidioi.mRNA.OKI2018_I69.chr1.g2511.t1.cds [Oikopleura dioica]